MEQKSNFLSVIIPCYGKHELAVVHIRECMNSTRVPDEIIVVNDGGEDDLKEKIQQLEKKTKIIYAKVLQDIKWNYTGARNLGFWLSRGDYISIEDQDHIPHKDFYKDAVDALEANPEAERCKTYKRWVISTEDILTLPVDKWTTLSSRPAHQDCAIIKRETYLKIKGYDERFAGEYGWSATDWRRRLIRAGVQNVNAGYQFVVASDKTRGLSYRNFRLARTNTECQSPHGILNFNYEFCEL